MCGCVLFGVTLAMLKHRDQQQLGEERVYLTNIDEFLKRGTGLRIKVT